MVADRVLTEVLSAFATTVVGEFTTDEVLRQLAHGALRLLPVEGAGIMAPRNEDLLRFAFATGPSVQAVATLERLQETLGYGPCRDSHRGQRLVEVGDLATEGEWPIYQEQALRAGLRSVTAVPLLARGRSWGVLDLYRTEPRRFDTEDLAAIRTLAHVATSYLVVTADRDAAREAQAELAHRAMHDPHTGLPVRWVFLEQLGHALSRLARHPGKVGVLFADVDGLKYVNDKYGHDTGDRLLLACVERIEAALRPSDVVARLGGDEFVVLLEDLADAEAAAAVARRILAELAQPCRANGHLLQPSASLGLALTDDPAVTPGALVAHADSAMYRAKRAGRGRYEVFDAASYAADRARDTVRDHTTATVRAAVRDQQLTLHYQPIFDVADPARSAAAGKASDPSRPHSAAPPAAARPVPASVYALEALVRWQHPERGLLRAQDFVPTADRAGVMPELGAWVLSAACAQLATWDRTLGADAPARLFVNVCADEFTSPDFARRLAEVLRRTGLAPDRLTLEITETGLITDPPAAARSLTSVQELGCQLAIDDFGTGYSSLSRLVDLPATTWKIDGSFTGDLADRPAAAAVVSAVLQMGRQLNRTVVVEGVENETTLEILRRLGCTYAQGFHLGRPQSAQHMTELLSTGRWGLVRDGDRARPAGT